MIFNPKYYYVIKKLTCYETCTFNISLDLIFVKKEDAILYCKYNNFWNMPGDGSNVREYYIKFDITKQDFQNFNDNEKKEEMYIKEQSIILDDFYDTTIDYDIYYLIYDISNDYAYNVRLITANQKE